MPLCVVMGHCSGVFSPKTAVPPLTAYRRIPASRRLAQPVQLTALHRFATFPPYGRFLRGRPAMGIYGMSGTREEGQAEAIPLQAPMP